MVTASEHETANLLQLDKPVVLIGMMGAGKTTIGRRLAKAIGLPFVDADAEIVDAAGCSISDIFELYGEAAFRDLERRVMLRLLAEGVTVIATGGGAFIQLSIRDAIKQHAISLWLKAEVQTLVQRVSKRDTRPLLKQGDPCAILTRLLEERGPIYATADIIVDSDAVPHEVTVQRIIERLSAYQGSVS